jgi:hypothetical protein
MVISTNLSRNAPTSFMIASRQHAFCKRCQSSDSIISSYTAMILEVQQMYHMIRAMIPMGDTGLYGSISDCLEMLAAAAAGIMTYPPEMFE